MVALILECPFSAVSKPMLAAKGSFCCFLVLQDVHILLFALLTLAQVFLFPHVFPLVIPIFAPFHI